MTQIVTTGSWRPMPGHEADFVNAWSEFAEWASTMPGSTTLRLGRDLSEPARFVSYAAWSDPESVHAWKTSPQFQGAMARVAQHVEDFQATELEIVASASDGFSAVALSSAGAVE